MQNTSEHFQYVGSSRVRSRAQRSGVLFAALALLLGTLSAVVPEIISPIAAERCDHSSHLEHRSDLWHL